jgi:hypothetical protein
MRQLLRAGLNQSQLLLLKSQRLLNLKKRRLLKLDVSTSPAYLAPQP